MVTTIKSSRLLKENEFPIEFYNLRNRLKTLQTNNTLAHQLGNNHQPTLQRIERIIDNFSANGKTGTKERYRLIINDVIGSLEALGESNGSIIFDQRTMNSTDITSTVNHLLSVLEVNFNPDVVNSYRRGGPGQVLIDFPLTTATDSFTRTSTLQIPASQTSATQIPATQIPATQISATQIPATPTSALRTTPIPPITNTPPQPIIWDTKKGVITNIYPPTQLSQVKDKVNVQVNRHTAYISYVRNGRSVNLTAELVGEADISSREFEKALKERFSSPNGGVDFLSRELRMSEIDSLLARNPGGVIEIGQFKNSIVPLQMNNRPVTLRINISNIGGYGEEITSRRNAGFGNQV
jgi:hypothetical protein